MKLRNAKKELLEEFANLGINTSKSPNFNIICASISFIGETTRIVSLKSNYTTQEYEDWLNKLDFEYDADFGTQVLYGTIWLTKGCWLSRAEYDGAEWWKLNMIPKIPKTLK